EDGIRDFHVTGVQTCALPILVIRTREYLCGVMPIEDALVMILLRFPQEVVAPDAFELPGRSLASHRISSREVAMAEQLVESMTEIGRASGRERGEGAGARGRV